MEPITFSTELTLEDWRALQLAAGERPLNSGTRKRRLLWRMPAIGMAALVTGVAVWLKGSESALFWVSGFITGFLFIALMGTIVARRLRPQPGGSFLGAVRFTLDSTGLRSTRAHAEGVTHWPQVLDVSVTPSHVFLWTDLTTAYVIPGRSLPEPLTTYTLAESIRAFRAAAPAGAAAEDFVAPAIDAPGSSRSRTGEAQPSVWQELVSVARFLGILPVNPARFVGRDLSIFVLGAILLAVWTVLDPLTASDDLEINWYMLPGLAWVAVGVLALAWVLARLSRPQVSYRQGLLLATGSLTIAMVVYVLYQRLDEGWFYAMLALAILWGGLYFRGGLRAITGLAQPRALVVAALGIVGFVTLSNALYVNPSIWYYADDDDDSEPGDGYVDAHTSARMEELQFAQQSRLDMELKQLAALPHKGPATWFVGFAGYGEQHVFADEIDLAAREMAGRYGSGDRSVLLVNDRRDPGKLPLASAPALHYTLRRLGAMMGPDDVLFLSLSSHGSEDGSISISNDGRPDADLGAVDLAAMLREAKIPWKVIVISACYAGSFIDALRDDHTIVLTAAAADRTSFGCSDDRDLTWFGEAFYRDAMPGAPTLRAAFEQARESIATMEKQEHYRASDPQAFFGAAMEKKLAAMEPADDAGPEMVPEHAIRQNSGDQE